MSDLTAVDILLNPEQAVVERARALNELLRRSVPTGFALDADHAPHVTVVQRFVRTADLAPMLGAVGTTIAETDLAALSLRAVAIRHVDWGVPGQGLAVLEIRPDAAVLDLQARLLAAVSPYVEPGGTAGAFVTDADDPDISRATIDWVEGFVPAQVGDAYLPHITLGFATLPDLVRMEAAPFDAFDVRPARVAAYRLGNNGNARQQLQAWPVTE